MKDSVNGQQQKQWDDGKVRNFLTRRGFFRILIKYKNSWGLKVSFLHPSMRLPSTLTKKNRQIWAKNVDKTPETEYKSLLAQIVYGGHRFMTLLLSTLRLSLAFNWSKKTSCHLIFRRLRRRCWCRALSHREKCVGFFIL